MLSRACSAEALLPQNASCPHYLIAILGELLSADVSHDSSSKGISQDVDHCSESVSDKRNGDVKSSALLGYRYTAITAAAATHVDVTQLILNQLAWVLLGVQLWEQSSAWPGFILSSVWLNCY